MDKHPIILLERFVNNGGWFEIIIIAMYSGYLGYKMKDPNNVAKYRRLSWLVFSIFFFSQFILGIIMDIRFLMTGKLHMPIPMMVLAGPIYRGQISVMTLLFLTTIILTGPAWCSQFCYFGAIDGNISTLKKKPQSWRKKGYALKWTAFFLVILLAIIFRLLGIKHTLTTLFAIGFGIVGILLIVFVSSKKGSMIHCVYYCPLGTMVNILKWVRSFRLTIQESCTFCMRCTSHCRYDALNLKALQKRKPDYTCTLCGDCISSCNHQSIQFNFFSLSPNAARNLYLFLTVTLHGIFLALARI